MRNILILGGLSLILVGGCTKDKSVHDSIAKIEARLAKIEKLLFPKEEEEEVQKEAIELPVGNSYILGKKDAEVNVVVFSNFQCPYCGRADSALRGLLKDDELKEKINIVFKHFPFERHTEARPASKAAMAAGEQGKFWEMAEKNFANQGDLNDKNYEKWAKEIGLDVAKFKTDLKNNDIKYDEKIDADVKLGSEKAQLRGTPWIMVGGWLLDGSLTPEGVKGVIAERKL